MSNTAALIVHALVFACLVPLSAIACIVRSVCTLNVDPQGTRAANVESNAAVQFQSARATESDNQTDMLAVTSMS